MKLLIRKGRLVDPVGGIGGVMDILIEDGKLAVIGSDLREPEARVIDARGLNVCRALNIRRTSPPERRRRPGEDSPP